MTKLHLIWDMDGTLVNSGPEILATVEKALTTVGLSLQDANPALRIGPPLSVMLRNSFPESILDDNRLGEVLKSFRPIYDSSDFEDTVPFPGIDEMIQSSDYVHHIITNKPEYATKRIVKMKGWEGRFIEILTPNTLIAEVGREMTKPELFKTWKSMYPDVTAIGIGDMAKDAECAKCIGIPAIGVLWGTGTKEELVACDEIAISTDELKDILMKYE